MALGGVADREKPAERARPELVPGNFVDQYVRSRSRAIGFYCK